MKIISSLGPSLDITDPAQSGIDRSFTIDTLEMSYSKRRDETIYSLRQASQLKSGEPFFPSTLEAFWCIDSLGKHIVAFIDNNRLSVDSL